MGAVGLGIVGCGVIGATHARWATACPGVDLVAVADLRREAATGIAARHRVPAVYSRGQELLADPGVEAVVLALPAAQRAALALSALAARKHVLIEKPVAMDSGEVRRLIAARGRQVAACASARFHFLAATRRVTEFIARGELGELRLLRCRVLVPAGPRPERPPPSWRLRRRENGGGILVNWGCYDLDYLLGITGWNLRPQTVLAQTWTIPAPLGGHVPPGSDGETHLTALVRCAGGCAINYERGEYVAGQAEATWEVIGEKGSLRLRMTPAPEKALLHFEVDAAAGTRPWTLWQGADSWDEVHAGLMADFRDSVRGQKEPQTTLERALVVQEITDAIYASARRGEAVTLA